MGYWNYGPLDNDPAQDWLLHVEKANLAAYIEITLALQNLSEYVAEVRVAAYSVIVLGEGRLWCGEKFQACVRRAIEQLTKVLDDAILTEQFIPEVRSEIQRLEALRLPILNPDRLKTLLS